VLLIKYINIVYIQIYGDMMACCGIWEKFDNENNTIKEYKYWKLLIRKNQAFLGACVAITKEHHDFLSELSEKEMAEYNEVVKDAEKALKKLWNFDGIHHLLLMMKDKHTHFHILPRYIETKEFAGLKWEDGYNKPPLGINNSPNQDVLNKIRDEIKKAIED
jgi:diadenosine tetraphosphate (Ap4A) HIT family hydrolase